MWGGKKGWMNGGGRWEWGGGRNDGGNVGVDVGMGEGNGEGWEGEMLREGRGNGGEVEREC
jgi:hypothetical protein